MNAPRDQAVTGTPTLLGEGARRRIVLPILASVPGLVHAFTVKGSDPDDVLRAAAGTSLPFRTLKQVHGATVRTVGPPDSPSGSRDAAEGDALVTAATGLALGVYVADCVPILVCDERTRGLAAVHAGWRGTVAGVLRAAIGALRDRFGARPADLRLGFGPSIGACCFEVGDDVVDLLLRADPGAGACVLGTGRRRVDLVEANRRQALDCGVPADRIQATALCTRCRDDLLESFRRGRGRAGRMAGLIAWRT